MHGTEIIKLVNAQQAQQFTLLKTSKKGCIKQIRHCGVIKCVDERIFLNILL